MIAAILLAVITIFSSCKKKDEPAPPNVLFSFALTDGGGFVSGDVTLKTGEQFKVGITAFAGTGNTLTRFEVIRKIDKPSYVLDSTLNSTSLNFDFLGIANDEVIEENWRFKITQSNGDTLEKTFVVTTEPSMGPIYTYDQRILGAFENANGSSFASSDGTIYDIPDAKVNAAKIDWLYYYGTADFATLASPDDDGAAHVFTDGGTYENPGPNALLNWSPRNATRFITILYTVDWDAIETDTQLFLLTQGATETMANSLKPGYFVAFVTANGKRGIIRINAVNAGEAGEIDISVKVQQ